MIKKTKNQKQIKKIAKKYKIKLLLLFGSQANKKTHKLSDVDVAYLSQKTLCLKKESNLIIDLMPFFKSEYIDLVNICQASPLLLYAIVNNCKKIYQSEPLLLANLQCYAFKSFIEAKPLFQLQKQRLLESL